MLLFFVSIAHEIEYWPIFPSNLIVLLLFLLVYYCIHAFTLWWALYLLFQLQKLIALWRKFKNRKFHWFSNCIQQRKFTHSASTLQNKSNAIPSVALHSQLNAFWEWIIASIIYKAEIRIVFLVIFSIQIKIFDPLLNFFGEIFLENLSWWSWSILGLPVGWVGAMKVFIKGLNEELFIDIRMWWYFFVKFLDFGAFL